MDLDRDRAPYSLSGSGLTAYRPPLSVLFVDPDTERSRRLAHLLRPTCAVEQVATGKAAAEVIARRAPDLIILDLTLRDVGGIEFIDYLHTLAATRNTLIMVLTRRASVREKIAALSAGADDYVIWPIDAEAFLVRVRLLSRFRRTLQW
jgi:DNA-binding response OmpR family regulator